MTLTDAVYTKPGWYATDPDDPLFLGERKGRKRGKREGPSADERLVVESNLDARDALRRGERP